MDDKAGSRCPGGLIGAVTFHFYVICDLFSKVALKAQRLEFRHIQNSFILRALIALF